MIELTTEQRAWLTAHIESGEFASEGEALSRLISERIAQEGADLAWAKPYVDEARSAVARGEVITLAEHRARNEARLSALLK